MKALMWIAVVLIALQVLLPAIALAAGWLGRAWGRRTTVSLTTWGRRPWHVRATLEPRRPTAWKVHRLERRPPEPRRLVHFESY